MGKQSDVLSRCEFVPASVRFFYHPLQTSSFFGEDKCFIMSMESEKGLPMAP